MERHPGKQTFADDFFIESLNGAGRVLGQPEKLTVETPLDIPLDRPWEPESAQFSTATYDEEAGQFRLYYNVWMEDRLLICAQRVP